MDTIFLVEDDMNIRRLTGMHLQLAGYDVRELEDAAAAREALKKGDHVLVAWVQEDPVVIDVILDADDVL